MLETHVNGTLSPMLPSRSHVVFMSEVELLDDLKMLGQILGLEFLSGLVVHFFVLLNQLGFDDHHVLISHLWIARITFKLHGIHHDTNELLQMLLVFWHGKRKSVLAVDQDGKKLLRDT